MKDALLGMRNSSHSGNRSENTPSNSNDNGDVQSFASQSYADSSSAISDSDRHPDDVDDRDDEDESIEKQILTNNEQMRVRGLRLLLILVLVGSMTATALLAYFLSTKWETNQFEAQFYEDSSKVLQSIGTSLDLTLQGMDALVVSIVSVARATNQSWPYVTVPDFAVRAEKIRTLTRALYINIYALVPYEERSAWETYSSIHGPGWVEETIEIQEREGSYAGVFDELNLTDTNVTYWNVIHDYDEWDKDEPGLEGLDPSDPGPFMPMWQFTPVIPVDPPYNWDLLSVPNNETILPAIYRNKVSIIEPYLIAYENDTDMIEENIAEADWVSSYVTTDEDPMEPMTDIYYPILLDAVDNIVLAKENYDGGSDGMKPEQHAVGGVLSASIYWRDLLKGILPPGSNGIVVVIHNECAPSFTYMVNGAEVEFMGTGDLHEVEYEDMKISAGLLHLDEYSIQGQAYTGLPVADEVCLYNIDVYPSSVMQDIYATSSPTVYACVVVAIFTFTSLVFVLYDWYVERRQRIVMKSAVRTNAIVSSLYPSAVRDKLLSETERKIDGKKQTTPAFSPSSPNLDDGEYDNDSGDLAPAGLPIAAAYEETTVFFGDIAGFTSWSSGREPAQVFTLLETIYRKFDKVAKRRGVYKIETVGDCYVAVTGLPRPRKNHAVIMARFAGDCRNHMNHLTRALELELGPGTSDLFLRIGLHSGAVTAGVIRGERSRFQLFGDTVNTAARMESTGTPNCIHCSQKTADKLIEAGKGDWITKRDTLVTAKGKGEMQTYWIDPKRSDNSSSEYASDHSSGDYTETDASDGLEDGSSYRMASDRKVSSSRALTKTKIDRLVEWTSMVFQMFLCKLIAHRMATEHPILSEERIEWPFMNEGRTLRDEVVFVIATSKAIPKRAVDPTAVQISEELVDQIRDFFSVIAYSCRPHRCHNFELASHITMSLIKSMQLVSKVAETSPKEKTKLKSLELVLDPLGQVALLFSSMISCVDHPGVPNIQLVKERAPNAMHYKGKCICEQNALDMAFKLLTEPSYELLYSYLFPTQEDLLRFRQMTINATMATDKYDIELRRMREQRWKDSILQPSKDDDDDVDEDNDGATSIFELLAEACSVCQGMQNWDIFEKWIKSLMEEVHDAVSVGRVEDIPADEWFESQRMFLNCHVIPLAEKMKQSQIFGLSGDAYFDSATGNRDEWENKGKAIIAEMKGTLQSSPVRLEL